MSLVIILEVLHVSELYTKYSCMLSYSRDQLEVPSDIPEFNK